MGRRRRFALLTQTTLLVGLIAGLSLLCTKARHEPLSRSVVFALDLPQQTEPMSSAIWHSLWESGIRVVVSRVGVPVDPEALAVGMKTIKLHSDDVLSLPCGDTCSDIAVVFEGNRVPHAYSPPPGTIYGIVDMVSARGYSALPVLRGALFRAYYPQPHFSTEEYLIAVRERQADLLVFTLRPRIDETGNFLAFLSDVDAGIQRDGHVLGDIPSLPVPYATSPVLKLLQALALGAAVNQLLFMVKPSLGRAGVFAFLVILSGLFFAGGWVIAGNSLVSRVFALGSAIVYPMVGLMRATYGSNQPRNPLAGFLNVCAWTALAGVAVAGFTSDYIFQMRIAQFSGIKIAYVLPLLLLYIVALRVFAIMHLQSRRQVAYISLLSVLFWIAVVILVIRSGNNPVVSVPDSEIAFREFLFRTLWVRPRTKEFLLHPVMLTGLYLLKNGRQIEGRFATLLGFIGQLSMVNTFAHAHHPIFISILRSGLGVGIGMVAALPIMYVTKRMTRARVEEKHG